MPLNLGYTSSDFLQKHSVKRCPECRRDYYDDSLLYCLDDGAGLLDGPASGGGSTAVLDPASVQARSADDETRRLEPNAPTRTSLPSVGTRRTLAWAFTALVVVLAVGASY